MINWFEVEPPDPDEDPDEYALSDDEQAFVSVVRERTAPWAGRDVSSMVFRFDDMDTLIASVSLADRGHHLVDIGVHLRDERVRGDRLHNQLYTLPDVPSPRALDLAGPLERLAHTAADWFIAALRRPVLLYVWLNDEHHAYAARYAFADTDETLVQTFNEHIAPAGQKEALIQAGHVHGKGWVQVKGLPTPHVYVHVRGDLDAAVIPAGARMVTQRGGLPGLWYQ